jgi:hypothetical protein
MERVVKTGAVECPANELDIIAAIVRQQNHSVV